MEIIEICKVGRVNLGERETKHSIVVKNSGLELNRLQFESKLDHLLLCDHLQMCHYGMSFTSQPYATFPISSPATSLLIVYSTPPPTPKLIF